jgi:subtilisin
MRTRKYTALALTAAAILAAAPFAAPVSAQTTAAPDSYIVVFRDGTSTDQVARDQATRYRFTVAHLYHTALNGYAAPMGAATAARLRAEPTVQYVAPDLTVQAPPGPGHWDHLPVDVSPFLPITQAAPYGIRRIGASTNGTSQTLANNGSGVNVAVLDTGIQLLHPDLQPVTSGKNCQNGNQPPEDDSGHGTHVAGTIAARDNLVGVVGVAPKAGLVAVKVLDSGGNGLVSAVICGIDWVTANKAASGIKVANLSLGGSGTVTASKANCTNSNDDALHTAICNSVKAGITYTVAAGNSGGSANAIVPAGYDEVIAVSAWSDTNGKSDAAGAPFACSSWGAQTDETYATGTNWDSAVDIAAPGVGIQSTVLGGAYGHKCGTSMAAPHVAGAAALALAKYPNLVPETVKAVLQFIASPLPHNAQHAENLLNVAALN